MEKVGCLPQGDVFDVSENDDKPCLATRRADELDCDLRVLLNNVVNLAVEHVTAIGHNKCAWVADDNVSSRRFEMKRALYQWFQGFSRHHACCRHLY